MQKFVQPKFSTPEEQIERLLQINEALWRDTSITEDAIKALGDPPNCPIPKPNEKSGLYCVVLLSETGNAAKTCRRNWDACVYVHGLKSTGKWTMIQLTSSGIQQRSFSILRPVGLRWAVAELGVAFQEFSAHGRVFCDDNHIMSMGQELPLIAALHDQWAVSMNGKDIPFVDAPDILVDTFNGGVFDSSSILCLTANKNLREIYLNSRDIHSRRDPSYYGPGSFR